MRARWSCAFDVPLDSWAELVVANAFYDQAGYTLLSDVYHSTTFGPWKRALAKVDKEETFHLLWGDLEVDLNGNSVALRPGDKLLIERGAMHGFRSVRGAIFMEISTTHVVGDSEYDDPAIAELDPMHRKTILDEW